MLTGCDGRMKSYWKPPWKSTENITFFCWAGEPVNKDDERNIEERLWLNVVFTKGHHLLALHPPPKKKKLEMRKRIHFKIILEGKETCFIESLKRNQMKIHVKHRTVGHLLVSGHWSESPQNRFSERNSITTIYHLSFYDYYLWIGDSGSNDTILPGRPWAILSAIFESSFHLLPGSVAGNFHSSLKASWSGRNFERSF